MMFRPFEPLIFIPELAYTLIVVIFCLMIYFKTREIYELTKYEGIRFFREAFLLFGISYIIRFFTGIMLFSNMALGPEGIGGPRNEFLPMLFIPPLMGYFSTIAIFYLVYSSYWKELNRKYMLSFFHLFAVILSVATFVTRSHMVLLVVQSVLLVTVVVSAFIMDKKKKKTKKISQTKIIYPLIFVLWIINLWIINMPRRPGPHGLFSRFEFGLVFQIISICVFLVIYHKIKKWNK